MTKVDRTVLKETGIAVVFTAVLTLLMNAVFLIGSWWDLTVLWGSLLGFAGASLDFFLMGLGVQKAVTRDEKSARNVIRLSQQGRLMMLALLLVVAFTVPVFHKVAALLPLFFPKIGVRLRAMFDPKIKNAGREDGVSIDDIESAGNGGEDP